MELMRGVIYSRLVFINFIVLIMFIYIIFGGVEGLVKYEKLEGKIKKR